MTANQRVAAESGYGMTWAPRRKRWSRRGNHRGRSGRFPDEAHLTHTVDVLVNNSATNLGQGPALDVTDEMLDKTVAINVKAALSLIRLTVPPMIEPGGGSIINIASISGLLPQPVGPLTHFT